MLAPSLPNTVTLTWDDSINLFIVERPFTFSYGGGNSVRKTVTVPTGFKTDLASVPKRLQSIVGKLGHHLVPAICHDYCYCGNVPGMTKREADKLFLEMMKTKKVWLGKRWAMWLAVRTNIKGGHW